MRRLGLNTLPILAAAALLASALLTLWAPTTTANAANHEPDVRSIGQKLQCPVCEGTSVADSRSRVAEDMRQVIRTKLAEGELESDIIDYFIESYGQGVLRQPPASGFYSAVWWVPGLGLLAGAAIIYGVVKRGRAIARTDAAPTEAEPPPEPPDELDHYLQRVRDLVRRSP